MSNWRHRPAAIPLLSFCLTVSLPCHAQSDAGGPAADAAASSENTSSTRENGATAQAEALFEEGMNLFDQERFSEALEKFRSSFKTVKSPNSRLMMARSLSKLGSTGAAFQMYELTLQDAEVAASEQERYENTAAAARDELAALRPKVGMVVVDIHGDVPSDATLAVGGVPVERELWSRPIAVTPGKAEVVLDADGLVPARETLTIEPGKTQRVALELEKVGPEPLKRQQPVDESKKKLRTGAYIASGVGLAGLVTFGLAVSTDASSAVSVLGIITAGLGIGGGITLYMLSDDDSTNASAAVEAGLGTVRVRGTF